MSIDLTGINNVNDFYTSHYLATYFEENVREAQARWKAAEEAGGSKSPSSALKGTANLFYKLLPEYERESNSDDQVNAVSEMAAALLEALGYGSANSVEIAVDDDVVYGVFHEECDAQGKPSLWVILANNKDAETDVLGSPALMGQMLSQGHEQLDNETLVNKLFFDVAEPPRFVILVSMTEAVLLDRNKWNEKRCIIFDLKPYSPARKTRRCGPWQRSWRGRAPAPKRAICCSTR
ncbi:MAG: hypothetical protein IJ087_17130 [Eggerthellaceae bacterium]|nr:hypothetical protein [Eggerthellaceae bacterium]